MQVRELICSLLEFHPYSSVMVSDDIVFQDEIEAEGLKECEIPTGHLYDVKGTDIVEGSVCLKFTNRAAKKLLTYEAKAKAYDRIKEEYSGLLSILCNDLSKEMKVFAEAWFRDYLDIDKGEGK